MSADERPADHQDERDKPALDPSGDPFVYRDVSEQLPNEALRSELETMNDEEREAYLKHLEELAREFLGPGGP